MPDQLDPGGPYITLPSNEDDAAMKRAMKGATTSRAAGIAHQTAEKNMPLTDKGKKIMSNMKSQYGDKKGESVFYASKNAGTIKGVEHAGGVIPTTGIYMMERGETVIPASRKGTPVHSGEKHTGAAENMTPFGPDESTVARANAPFRDLHKSGHDLNHSYKNPVAAVAPDVKAAGTNHSYLHPHSHANLRDTAKTAWNTANKVKGMNEVGTGKS